MITATACSEDKQWIVTADEGDDSMLVVWNSLTAVPERTYFNPHVNGTKAIAISADNKYIVTLGNEKDNEPQTMLLWDWQNYNEEGYICSIKFEFPQQSASKLHFVTFNPRDPHQIAANSQKRVLFLSWEDGVDKFEYYSPCTSQKDYASRDKYDNKFTKTVFIPGGDQAVTGTDKGDIIVWDKSLIIEGIGEQNEKRLIKVVTLNNDKMPSIDVLTVHHKYLVVGN